MRVYKCKCMYSACMLFRDWLVHAIRLCPSNCKDVGRYWKCSLFNDWYIIAGFQICHRSRLSALWAVLFKISGIQVFKVQVRLWNYLSIIVVIHKYTKIALSIVCIGGYTMNLSPSSAEQWVWFFRVEWGNIHLISTCWTTVLWGSQSQQFSVLLKQFIHNLISQLTGN